MLIFQNQMHIQGTTAAQRLFSSTIFTLHISRAEDQGQSNLPAAATTADVGRIDPQSLPSSFPSLAHNTVYFAKVGKGNEREADTRVICSALLARSVCEFQP